MKTLNKDLLEKTLKQLKKRNDDLRYIAMVADVDKEEKILAGRNAHEVLECISELEKFLKNGE